MQTNYFQSVLSFLKSSTELIVEQNYKSPVPSPFHQIHFPEKKITVHVVELDSEKLSSCPANLFVTMSDDAAKHHIKLIHLWEDVWLKKNEAVRLRLLSQLGTGKKIHGRLTEVTRTEKNISEDFLNKYHLQESANGHFSYGLNFKNDLMSIATFSKGRLMTYEKENYLSYELIRFASKSGFSIVGGLSKLIAAFIKEQNAVHLMSYADRDWSNGNSYSKLGFKKIEDTAPQQFWISKNEMQRLYEHRLPKELLNEFNLEKKITREEFLTAKGFFKIYNSGNTKFILDLRQNETL